MGLPTTNEAVEDEELRLGSNLPEVIKPLIIKNNGGAKCVATIWKNEVWNLYAVKDTRSKKHISRSANHIERETKSAREWYGFPENGIALGGNGAGDYLIALKGSPSIYIWDHETGEMWESPIKPFS